MIMMMKEMHEDLYIPMELAIIPPRSQCITASCPRVSSRLHNITELDSTIFNWKVVS
jgi:hypothetical protein